MGTHMILMKVWTKDSVASLWIFYCNCIKEFLKSRFMCAQVSKCQRPKAFLDNLTKPGHELCWWFIVPLSKDAMC